MGRRPFQPAQPGQGGTRKRMWLFKRATKRVASTLIFEGFFMIATSLIKPETLRAYQATDYRLDFDQQEIILNIGKYSHQLATLFFKHDVNCGSFITAYNPQGKIQSDQANEQAHAQLFMQLQDLSQLINDVPFGPTC